MGRQAHKGIKRPRSWGKRVAPIWIIRKRLAEQRDAKSFTGNCPVRQHTADGALTGRCWHSTYGGRCHLHGDVSRLLGEGADLTDADDRRAEFGGGDAQ